MERSAGESELSHSFPPDRYPYPEAAVQQRWQHLLRDREVSVWIGEALGAPVGFVAFDSATVRHLGVWPSHTRRGYGAALLALATSEMCPAGVGEAQLWVLSANTAAQAFYGSQGWSASGETRPCEFPPFPEEMRWSISPAAARRR